MALFQYADLGFSDRRTRLIPTFKSSKEEVIAQCIVCSESLASDSSAPNAERQALIRGLPGRTNLDPVCGSGAHVEQSTLGQSRLYRCNTWGWSMDQILFINISMIGMVNQACALLWCPLTHRILSPGCTSHIHRLLRRQVKAPGRLPLSVTLNVKNTRSSVWNSHWLEMGAYANVE